MPVELKKENESKVLNVYVSGKLEKQDYEKFTPEVERMIEQHGKIRVLLETHDFRGWTAGSVWEDIKFDAKHYSDIERLAIIGEKKWEAGMATFCKPFTSAKVRFFEPSEAEEARTWVQAA